MCCLINHVNMHSLRKVKTVIFPGVGAFEQLFGPVRGDLNKNLPKIQMPGGMLNLRFDWYISRNISILKKINFDWLESLSSPLNVTPVSVGWTSRMKKHLAIPTCEMARSLSFIYGRFDGEKHVGLDKKRQPGQKEPYPYYHYSARPANSHGFAVSLTIFCHFSRSHDKAPNLTVFWQKSFWKEVNKVVEYKSRNGIFTGNASAIKW